MKKILFTFFIVAGALSVTFVSSCKKKKDENPPPSLTGPQYGSMTDSRDNKTYKTIDIAGKTWMAENLNYEEALSSGTSICPSNNEDSCTKYGREYDGDAAIVACPAGWHLPSDAEWRTLEHNLGMSDADTAKSGLSTKRGVAQAVGIKLQKAGGTGFDAVTYSGAAQFWTSTKVSGGNQYFRGLIPNDSSVYRHTNPPGLTMCVRCIKD